MDRLYQVYTGSLFALLAVGMALATLRLGRLDLRAFAEMQLRQSPSTFWGVNFLLVCIFSARSLVELLTWKGVLNLEANGQFEVTPSPRLDSFVTFHPSHLPAAEPILSSPVSFLTR